MIRLVLGLGHANWHKGSLAVPVPGAFLLLAFALLIGSPEALASRITVSLRMDDSGFGRHASALRGGILTDAEITRQVIEIIAKNGARLTVGVTPNVVSGSPGYNPPEPKYLLLSSCSEELAVLRNAAKYEYVEIALHGWTHQEVTRYDGRPSEFGGLPLEEQSSRLDRGREELQRCLDIPIEIFVPPFNNHDHTTLLALRELGFKTVSSEARTDDTVEGLCYVPCTTSLRELRSAVAEALHSGQQTFIMAVFHGYDFTESGWNGAWLSLGYFDDLVREVSETRDVEFVTVAAAVANRNDEFNGQHSRRYAACRDRVERVGDILAPIGPGRSILRTALTTGMVFYPEPQLRRLTRQMLFVEMAVNALLGVAVACSCLLGLKVLQHFRWASQILALFLAGGFISLAFLLTEGLVGIVGRQAGFGSRLVVMITCTGAGLVVGLTQSSKQIRR